MSTETKNTLREIMSLAWQFVKRNGYSIKEALKCAWINARLKTKMKAEIVRFYFKKVDGYIREAFGTLNDRFMPASDGQSKRGTNDTVQVYFDTEKGEFRCFKKANIVSIGTNIALSFNNYN